MINLVKKTTTDELSLGIKHTISKESVLRESTNHNPHSASNSADFDSGAKGPRSRYPGHSFHNVSQMSSFDNAHDSSMQIQCLHSQSVL